MQTPACNVRTAMNHEEKMQYNTLHLLPKHGMVKFHNYVIPSSPHVPLQSPGVVIPSRVGRNFWEGVEVSIKEVKYL